MKLFLFVALCVVGTHAATSWEEEERQERLLGVLKKWIGNVAEPPSDNDDDTKRAMNTCRPEFAELKQHTMCVYKPSSDSSNCGVSAADKKLILDLHNKLRSEVNPSASQMMKLEWSDDAAEVAQMYAQSCPNGHDKNRDVLGIYTGQNLAFNQLTWRQAVQDWYDEVKDFKYGVGSTNGGVVGHFTQVVYGTTNLVGCGFCNCKNNKWERYYVCNYVSGQSKPKTPYPSGRSCSKCPGNCVNNLCDCKGKVCLNGGTLDPSTCQCTCKAPFTGTVCEKKDCPVVDGKMCWGEQPYGYGKTECRFSNIPPMCPNMCGVCPNKCPGKTVDSCKNGGVIDANTCKCNCRTGFSGDLCNKRANCGTDAPYCGKQWPQKYCTMYSNVPDVCPNMCGKCA